MPSYHCEYVISVGAMKCEIAQKSCCGVSDQVLYSVFKNTD